MDRLQTAYDMGIANFLALRGDIPENFSPSDWDYKHAIDLVYEIKKFNKDFCVGGACYPEVHPESLNQKEDIYYLKQKVEAGCDFLTTQMFFDNNLLYNFLYKIREAGINVPIVAGIMPVTNPKSIKRICRISGAALPQRFCRIVDKFGNNPEQMKKGNETLPPMRERANKEGDISEALGVQNMADLTGLARQIPSLIYSACHYNIFLHYFFLLLIESF